MTTYRAQVWQIHKEDNEVVFETVHRHGDESAYWPDFGSPDGLQKALDLDDEAMRALSEYGEIYVSDGYTELCIEVEEI